MRFKGALIAMWLIIIGGCVSSGTAEDFQTGSGLVERYLIEFNQHDVDGMRDFWADDIEWVDVSGDSIVVISDSANELAEMMIGYFSDHPDVQSSTEIVLQSGKSLAFVETATWTQSGEVQSQEALAFYQLNDGKISRFWYLASE
ncbi:MAG: nuclear transport factor 2 family protein [Pseudomonadota bacterium]